MRFKIVICFLLSVFIFGAANLHAQKIEIKKDSLKNYIESDGTIYNAVKSVIGYIKIDNSIENSGHFVIGHLLPNGDILNDSNKLVGYIEADGTVKNARGIKLGAILDDGTIEDNKHKTLDTAPGIRKEWLAVVYFFFAE
jgi:hypothetical protein